MRLGNGDQLASDALLGPELHSRGPDNNVYVRLLVYKICLAGNLVGEQIIVCIKSIGSIVRSPIRADDCARSRLPYFDLFPSEDDSHTGELRSDSRRLIHHQER